jgi:uncharacterized protein YprB with RNaseH-like and TPR domain
MRLRDRLASFSTSPAASASSVASTPRRQVEEVEWQAAEGETAEGETKSRRIAQLRALIATMQAHAGPPAASRARLAAPPPLPVGETRHTSAGPLHCVERWLDPQHRHGRIAVRLALDADPGVLARLALDPALEALDLSRMLILDTETTGLAGGTGSVPFLIGLAWFEQGALKLEQLFLTNFGAEAPLLQHLAERLAQASCIVTYNGKAFDWPLLRTRFVLNRIACPTPPPHVDLLHCARRVLKQRLSSLRLIEVERALLCFYRDDDIDGAEIPGRYLAYLRGSDPRLILPVFTHNEHDVIALSAILWWLCAHFERLEPSDDPRDHLSYAKVALRAGDLERARLFGEAAAAGGASADLQRAAFCLCATVARRRGDMTGAACFWQRVLELAGCEWAVAEAHLALSRLYEHQLGDLQRASEHAHWTRPAEGEIAHARRQSRLRRRLERCL